MTPDPTKTAPDPVGTYSPASIAHPLNLSAGDVWDDRYEIERELGRGGGALVFLARDRTDGSVLALKILRPELSIAVGEARFQREISIARQLKHPNILTLLDVGSAQGLLYFTMPYVEGGTLRELLRRERQLPLKVAIALARDVAGALDHAHGEKVIHRDIKPGNILLSKDSAVVADFGIAKAMSVPPGSDITPSGISLGTPEYMSPEQGTSPHDLDGRSDIYSLGCVFYEMIAGEPPFTGPNTQAIVARHCVAPPPSVRVIRPTIPVSVDRTIQKALAKVPADRYQTATELVDAIEAGDSWLYEFFAAISRRLWLVVVVGLAALTGVVLWSLRPAATPLDRNRVVVFPLHDPAVGGSRAGTGEDVATFIGYALDGTRPLKWIDGWELLDSSTRTKASRLEPREARRLSRRAGAGYYVDGSIVRRPDSVTVILRLYDLAGDSLVRLEGRSAIAAGASAPQLGLEAIRSLLPAVIAPGGRLDLTALSERQPTAVANFLQGEREYRRMQFRPALAHYELALREDSAFGLAALRGAQAANWLSDFDADVRLSEVAVRHSESFPPAQSLLTRGLHAYLTGAADSAVTYLKRAVQRDSAIHPAWTLLAEVYLRLLPADHSADSLARNALERARLIDSDFAPTLLLLEEIALRDGNIPRALALRGELAKAGADTTHAAARALMLTCVRDGPSRIDWETAARLDPMVVLGSGKVLAGHAAQPKCALPAFRSLLVTDQFVPGVRWAALMGVLGQLAATGRGNEMEAALTEKGTSGLRVALASLLISSAGWGADGRAAVAADSAALSYDSQTVGRLWFVGSYEARRSNLPRLRLIALALEKKADSSGSRRDRLLSRAINARLRLVEGDSTGATQALRALVPSGTRREIIWEPWESLGPERMALAELLYARGAYEEARRVATLLDSPEPVTYPLYLRRSLELRADIARKLNNSRMEVEYRRRLQRLSSD
jgi:Tfp pilus assembly protein PilF